jgi:superfamily II DNA/RNA helicase
METFTDLGVSPVFIERLAVRSISQPTAIQRLVIPPLREGRKVIFRSATGTGKTFAYLLPALASLPDGAEDPAGPPPSPYRGPEVLICAPTFELCSQIKGEIDFLLQGHSARSGGAALLIGSVSLNRQIDGLKKNRPWAAVGNPGRLLVLAKMGKLKLRGLRFLVFDEADRLAAEESREEIREFAGLAQRELRGRDYAAAACSATVSGVIAELLAPLFDGAEIVSSDEQEILRERIEHWALFSESRRKIQTLRSLLAALTAGKAGRKVLVFAGGNDEAGKVLSQLQFHHLSAAGLFGAMDKRDRKAAVESFRSGSIKVLVASDLAARGLDIPGVSHVIALDVPGSEEIYIHRAGRTGRAGKRGVMVSIGDETAMRRLAALEKKLGIIVRPKELFNGKIITPDYD